MYRVNGELNLSRSLGSAKHKPYVSSTPDYNTFELDYSSDLLVMCSDGLLEKLSVDELGTAIQDMRRMGLSPDAICNSLI